MLRFISSRRRLYFCSELEIYAIIDSVLAIRKKLPSLFSELQRLVSYFCRFSLALAVVPSDVGFMKNYSRVLLSILAAMICTAGFAADKPNCQKTGKNCPMNDNKACNCGKSCDCGK